MSKPVLEYYWVKVLEDGKTTIPQFDLVTGNENLWDADNVPLHSVIYMPFTPELANKVTATGTPAVPSTNAPVEFVVKDGEIVVAGRDNKITVFDFFKCDVCNWRFQYVKEPGKPFAKCPQCGAEDEWYCSRCHENKHEYRITKLNQVQCLDCDVPTGLDRKKKLIRMQGINHTCDYFIRSENRKMTIVDKGRIIYE